MKPVIHFFFQNTLISLPPKKRLQHFIWRIFKEENKTLAELSFIFCSDEYLLGMNKKFLSHNYYTDILTFDLSENEEIKGEIYISTNRIKENAKALKISTKQELLRVIFHGILHLCGYSDKTNLDKSIMTAKEDDCLNRWNKGTYFT